MEHKVKHKTKHGMIVTTNKAQPVTGERYDFEVYVEAPSADEVDRVEYVLHETFPNPIRERQDPQDNFALKSNGWGEFDIGIKVHFRDGTVERLRHPLKLFDQA